jgi:16S rRNA (cytosine967-C5)-methyltransferase
MDIEDNKLTELKKRASRNGVKNLETMLIESDEVIEPAFGNGRPTACWMFRVRDWAYLRRHPDTKWKLKPEFLENIRKVQWHILSTYSNMVKKGGKMVYATCSVLPSESEEQVKRFVKAEKKRNGNLISEHRTSVSKDGFDGFYMARLERK